MDNPLLLFDIDGVLNRERGCRHANGYNGLNHECIENFNRIIAEVPSVDLVVISSWRYDILSGRQSFKGFESMLLTHGVNCHGKIIGHTKSDEEICGHGRTGDWLKEKGSIIRHHQVADYLWGEMGDPGQGSGQRRFCIIDDLAIGVRNQVITNPRHGLAVDDVEVALMILRDEWPGDAAISELSEAAEFGGISGPKPATYTRQAYEPMAGPGTRFGFS